MIQVPVATYDFAGTGALSGDWTQLNTSAGADFERLNGRGAPESSGALCFARWSGAAFLDDQYSKMVAYDVNSYDHYALVGVRESGTTNNDGYDFTADGATGSPDHSVLNRFDGGVPTTLQNFSTGGFSDGAVMKMTVVGTELKMWVDDVQVGSTEDDSTHSSGQPSAGCYDVGGTGEITDDWEGGNIISNVILRRRIEAA